MTYAIVPAAGLSQRMGRPKLSLPLGNSTVLECVITSLRNGGVDTVLVVVGPQTPELVSLANKANALSLLLPSPTADMKETVQIGLRWLEEFHHPRSEDFWFLSPGDCPAFSSTSVGKLLDHARTSSGPGIFNPTVQGRRGHPTLFSWLHVPEIFAIPNGMGIDSFVRSQNVREVPVEDHGVLVDLDGPFEYQRFQNDPT